MTTQALQQAKETLEKIARWHGEFPSSEKTWDDGSPMSYGAAFGSNGERDYMREIALKALAALATVSDAPTSTVSVQPSTPSSRWAGSGEPDPHDDRYDCERAALTLGKLTDDELANAAFMNYDIRPSFQDIVDGKAHMPIVYMTAVKDRIRWLSRSLEKALASPAPAVNSEATGELLDLLREALPVVRFSFEQPIKGQELAQRISAAIGAPMPTRGVNIGVYIDNNSGD